MSQGQGINWAGKCQGLNRAGEGQGIVRAGYRNKKGRTKRRIS